MDRDILQAIVDTLDAAGTVGVLIVIIFTGVKKWWVFGWVYRDKCAEAEEWKNLALTGTRIAEHVASQIPSRRRGTDRTET